LQEIKKTNFQGTFPP